MHGAQHVEQWDSFLTRVFNRSRGGNRDHDIPLGIQERLPSGEDRLWEIGCSVSGPLNVNAAGFDLLCR